MNNEEKILELLEKHGEMLEKQGALLEKHGEMLEKQGALLEKHSEMLTQMQGDLTSVKDDLNGVKEDLAHVKARLDYDVDKRLDAINEGIDTILETMVSKSRVEQLEDDVIVLKTAVKMLTQEVAELKKAQ